MHFLQLTQGPPITLELAVTPFERARGLQRRSTLQENHGMLFIFPGEGVWSFHMKDTFLPLDLLFFNERGVLVGFIDGAKPLSEESLYVPVPARYVLEIAAGWRKRHKVRIGDQFLDGK